MNMKQSILFCLFLLFVSSCNGEQRSDAYKPHIPSKEIVAIHNKAYWMVVRNGEDKDTLRLAIKLLDKAIAMDPDYQLAYHHKAEYLEHLSPGKSGAVIDAYLSRDPEDPYFLTGRGLYYDKYKQKAEARKYYQRARDNFMTAYRSTGEPEKLFNWCFVMALLGDKDKAWEKYQKEREKFSAENREAYDLMMDHIMKGGLDGFSKSFWSEPFRKWDIQPPKDEL